MAPLVLEILSDCFIGWFYVYGFWLYASELVFCSVPFTAIGTILFFFAVNFFRIPTPDKLSVLEIFGSDPKVDEIIVNNETDKTDGDNDKETYCMKVVAHRAAPFDAPENSLSAIRKCKEKGCLAIEIDISLTADDVPIIFHDDHVDRITEATGQIREMTWAELKDLDISAKHPFKEKFPDERILLFEDAIEEIVKLDLRVFLDCKGFTWKETVQMVPIIVEVFKKYPSLYHRAVVSSFNPLLIFMVRRADPHIVCSMAWRPKFFSIKSYHGNILEGRPRFRKFYAHIAARITDVIHDWLFHNILFYLLGLSAILIHKDSVTLSYVDKWSKRGVRVIPWSVNLPTEKQFFSKILKVGYLTDTLDTRVM